MGKKKIRRVQAVILAVVMCFSVLGGILMSGSVSYTVVKIVEAFYNSYILF